MTAPRLYLVQEAVMLLNNRELPITQNPLHGNQIAAVVPRVDEHCDRAKQVRVDGQPRMLFDAILDLLAKGADSLRSASFPCE